MTKQLRLCVCVFAISGIAAATTFGGQTIDNPTYQHWAKFKPGSFSKLKNVSKAMGRITESTITKTLKSVTKEKVVVEMISVTKAAGQEFKMPPQKMEYLAKVPKPKANMGKPKADPEIKDANLKEGKEVLQVKGKKIKTQWHETTVKQGSMTSHTKAWTSDEIPGQIVKSITKTVGQMKMTVETTLLDFKAIKK